MYLLALDSTGTQPYIFGSNSLRHNIGASHLVAQATGPWALKAVVQAAAGRRTNVEDPDAVALRDSGDQDYWIEENDDLAAEVLYAGGGNVVALFREEHVADDFREYLSRRLVERAPELKLVEEGRQFDWNTTEEEHAAAEPSLSAALNAVLRALGRKKAARRIPSRPVNRSVTQSGRIHGQPAVAMQEQPGENPDGDAYPISAEAKAKEQYLDLANERLKKLLTPPDDYAYPYELDKLGGAKGKQRFVAVVHADGDRMGKLLQRVARGTSAEKPDTDRAFIQRIRAFSEEVREAALGATKDVVQGLHAFIEKHRNGGDEVGLPHVKAPLQLDSNDDGDLLLPLRPIVFGGDDVTFVCDGRLGPALAARYVRCFEHHVEESDLLCTYGKTTASAGVAIVKARYPFSRAYVLAEELTRSAKDERPQSATGSYMDWHVALGEIEGALDTVRRSYRLPALAGPPRRRKRVLTVRPVAVTGASDSAVKRWEYIRNRLRDFRESEQARGKLKDLRDKLRKGRTAVQAFVQEQNLEDLFRHHPDGYCGDETPYLDVLELVDLALLDDELENCDGATTNEAREA